MVDPCELEGLPRGVKEELRALLSYLGKLVESVERIGRRHSPQPSSTSRSPDPHQLRSPRLLAQHARACSARALRMDGAACCKASREPMLILVCDVSTPEMPYLSVLEHTPPRNRTSDKRWHMGPCIRDVSKVDETDMEELCRDFQRKLSLTNVSRETEHIRDSALKLCMAPIQTKSSPAGRTAALRALEDALWEANHVRQDLNMVIITNQVADGMGGSPNATFPVHDTIILLKNLDAGRQEHRKASARPGSRPLMIKDAAASHKVQLPRNRGLGSTSGAFSCEDWPAAVDIHWEDLTPTLPSHLPLLLMDRPWEEASSDSEEQGRGVSLEEGSMGKIDEFQYLRAPIGVKRSRSLASSELDASELSLELEDGGLPPLPALDDERIGSPRVRARIERVASTRKRAPELEGSLERAQSSPINALQERIKRVRLDLAEEKLHGAAAEEEEEVAVGAAEGSAGGQSVAGGASDTASSQQALVNGAQGAVSSAALGPPTGKRRWSGSSYDEDKREGSVRKSHRFSEPTLCMFDAASHPGVNERRRLQHQEADEEGAHNRHHQAEPCRSTRPASLVVSPM